MFGGGFGGGGGMFNDPLFNNMFGHMQRQMDQMEQMMMGGPMMFPNDPRSQMMLENGGHRNMHGNSHNQLAHPFASPFGGGGMGMMPFGMGLFGNIHRQMDTMREQAMQNPNAHVYTHSTIINYDGTGTGAPRYQEHTSEVRKSGAAKEVRRTVRDSATGEERMEIAHHLGDRAHIIEKKRRNGGRIEEEQKFVNLKEDEAPDFDRQFGHATRGPSASSSTRRILPSLPPGITRSGSRQRRHHQEEPNGPIIEEPPDDDDEPPVQENKRSRNGRSYNA